MTIQDVKEKRVIKDGKPALQLSFYRNGVLDHIEYVTDKELIF